MRRTLIAALKRIVLGFKTLKWSEVNYENFLKAIDQQGAPDMGDWEDDISDYDLRVDREDYEDEEEYLDARTEAYKSLMESKFDDWYYKYKNLKFPLTLYRAVCLSNLEELRRDDLGFDWTDEIDSAQCYHSHRKSGDNYYYLVAEVERNNVDWTDTIANNLNPSFGEDEQEINLLENTKVKIADILDGNEKSLGESFVGNTGKYTRST